MDKYNLISFAPSIAIVVAMLIMTGVGIKLLARVIKKDAEAAGE